MRNIASLIAFILIVLLVMATQVHAHEMGTSALRLTELSPGKGQLVFKKTRSVSGDIAPISFSLTPACQLHNANTTWEGRTEVQQVAEFSCNGPLSAHSIRVDGFTRLAPDLIVSVRYADGSQRVQVASVTHALLSLEDNATPAPVDLDYIRIGVEHILTGMDHMLFITGLFLLWRQRKETVRALLGRFTIFTVAHSITLALLVLGLITVPERAIEALIALSVLWVAFELLEDKKPKNAYSTNLTVAAFGLLHGSGFALSMVGRGFPKDNLVPTLFLFNTGIELGQLLIVSSLIGFFFVADKWVPLRGRFAVEWMLTILMGGSALYWTIDRVMVYV